MGVICYTLCIVPAASFAPSAIFLTNIECLGRNRDTGEADYRVCNAVHEAIKSLPRAMYDGESDAEHPTIVIASTCRKKEVVAEIKSLFLHQVS